MPRDESDIGGLGVMRRGLRIAGLWLAAAFAVFTSIAFASEEAAQASFGATVPLMPGEVLDSSARHVPVILESLSKRRAAQGDLLATQGAFDLVFSGDALGWAGGFYDGRTVGAEARQRFRTFGTEVYGGYSISRGDFPIYQDENFTPRGGKPKIGVIFSLLRDRDIDPQRFAERDAQIAVAAADLDLLLTRIGVQQQASVAYWRWVKSGHQMRVYDSLVEIALQRESGLERQVESGARASIFLTENRQNILRRQRFARAARREFELAGNELAFYLRDTEGRPSVPGVERLPPLRDQTVPLVLESELDLPTALLERPELRLLRNAVRRADNRIELGQNAMRPRVDLKLEVGDGLGETGDGGTSRDTTDTIVGLEVSVPMQRRKARGELAAERAERDALQFAQRQLSERIEVEVRKILVELEASLELVNIAADEVEQAKLMQNAEVRRFESGASDFFLVNLREEAAADAQVRYLSAELERRVAETEYAAATVDLSALGLE